MHTFRLHFQSSKLCKQLTYSLSKKVKTNFRAFCTLKVTPESDLADFEQFKAAVLHPKKVNLNVETLVLPNAISDDMVRIGIDYCALNSCDVKCINKEINSMMLPFIPGSEFSGEILELGPNCKKDFKVGDKVAVLSRSKSLGGGLSNQCFVPETECIRIDPRLSTEQSTTVIQGYSNALLAFTKYMPLNEGDDIIVCAGPGGDGLAAIEVADKIFKANVYILFSASSVNSLLRRDSIYKAMNINGGPTKVYKYFKKQLPSKTFMAVYDCYNPKLLGTIAEFISPQGHFLTDDPFFDPESFEPLDFKKATGWEYKKMKKADDRKIDEHAKKLGLSFGDMIQWMREMHIKSVPELEQYLKEYEVEENGEIAAPEYIHWKKKIRKVDVTEYQTSDPEFYEKIVNQVFEWYATGKIKPYVSQTWKLRDINKAIQSVTNKECLGKVLIKT